MTIGMYIIAILPAMLLIAGVYCFGHKSRIPIKHILVVSAVGTLTIPLSWLFSTLTQTFSWYPTVINTLADGILTALLDAALPEELAKWLMLLLVLFCSKHYSNRYAAIVYAVCISMSFASLENVWYLGKDTATVFVIVMRSIMAVPGHCLHAIIMGYFISNVKFDHNDYNSKWINILLSLFLPITIHCIYNAFIECFTICNLRGWYTALWLLFIVDIAFFITLCKISILILKKTKNQEF